jgi:hypothetical protein
MVRFARRSGWIGLAAWALAGLVFPAAASAATQLARSVAFAPNAGASGPVQSECQLQTLVPQGVQQASSEVTLVDAPAKGGRWLELTISEVHAPGGGPFSGPKWMTVTGTLHDRGKTIGSFRAKRVTTGVRSTCGSLQKIAQVIGQDIAGWLAAPSMNAEIGDAR